MTEVTVTRSIVVDADPATVWARIVSPEGINHEFGPVLALRLPATLRKATIATVPLGTPLGRAWILLLGVLPLEYDDMCLVSVDAPHRFHERSSMASASLWQHRRELDALPDGRTCVTDHLHMRPRLPLLALPARAIISALFAHRLRRLASWARQDAGPPRPTDPAADSNR